MASAIKEQIRILTFNLWHGGEMSRLPLEATLNVIRVTKADVVGLQETAGLERDGVRSENAKRIAEKLGWNYYNQGILNPDLPLPFRHPQGIITRFKILEPTPNRWGIKVQTDSGNLFYIFNGHLAYWPYQPYQLLNIPYEDAPFLKSEEEAIQAAKQARGLQVQQILSDADFCSAKENCPIFLTADLNEPSHLDWTDAAVSMKRCPLSVKWPTTSALAESGFQDAFRMKFPNEILHPGITWQTRTKEEDPQDHHDRIDFIMVKGTGAELMDIQMIGEDPSKADLVILPFPSDHRAILASFKIHSTLATNDQIQKNKG